MDKLCGPESLQVVCHRFSDGVDVVKCISGFIKEVGDVEQSYSNSLEKLVNSHLYNFHSNIIMQLIGSNPYEEIGTIKYTWSELGSQLTILARMHAEKAQDYLDKVRKPLLDLTPTLEDTRKELKNKARVLKSDLEAAASKHDKEKQKCMQIRDNLEKYLARMSEEVTTKPRVIAEEKAHMKNKERIEQVKKELRVQEQVYHDAHQKHVETKERFDREVKDLYKTIHIKETERVNALKKSLLEFTRTLSNTAPAYLESMQKITNTVSLIDCDGYIQLFVDQHQSLMNQSDVPELKNYSNLEDKNGIPDPSGDHTRADTPPWDLKSSNSSTVPPMSSVEEHHDASSSSIATSSEASSGQEVKGRTQNNHHHHHHHHIDRNDDNSSSSSFSSESRHIFPKPRKPFRPKKPTAVMVVVQDQMDKTECAQSGSTSESSTPSRHPPSQVTGKVSRLPSQVTGKVSRPPSQVTGQVSRLPSQVTGKLSRPPSQVNGQVSRSPSQVTGKVSRPPSQVTGQVSRPPSQVTGQVSHPPSLIGPGNLTIHSSSASNPKTPTKETCERTIGRPGTIGTQEPPQSRTQRPELAPHRGPQSSAQRPELAPHLGPPQSRTQRPELAPHLGPPQSSAQRPELAPHLGPRSSAQVSHHHGGVGQQLSEEEKVYSELMSKSETNDYYALLGVTPDASDAELAKARRDKSRLLHPDHYANDEQQKAKNQEELALINQVFQDMLKHEKSRELYDRLCAFRKKFPLIMKQNKRGLEKAQVKLTELRQSLKRVQSPLELLDELDSALNLIETRMNMDT